MRRAAWEELHDLGNLDLFCRWVQFGGLERGMSRQELLDMSPEDKHDWDLLMRLYGEFARAYRAEKEDRRKRK